MPPPLSTQTRTIGRTLNALRTSLGLSLDELAEKSGISKTSLWAYEQGQRTISNGARQRLLDAVADEMHARSPK